MNSLFISKDIYSVLTTESSLTSYVSTKVFPIVAEEGTTYPFIVYKRDSVSSLSCKCGVYEDLVSFTISVLSSEYLQGLEIADLVRNIIQKKLNSSIENHTYRNIQLVGCNEDFTNEGWVQTLNFSVNVEYSKPYIPQSCDLYLVSYTDDEKLKVVKAVNHFLLLGLAESRNLVESAPVLMPNMENILVSDANQFISDFHDYNDNNAVFELRNIH